MNNFKIGLEKKPLTENLQLKEEANIFIMPFKEMPSTNNIEKVTADRINAHDLFSFYTADVIKEDIVYAR